MRAKLTKRVVEGIAPRDRDLIVWDTELRGFGCKVTPKGRRSYLLYYRTAEGQQRKPALGTHGTLTCEQARDIARSMLADVARAATPRLPNGQGAQRRPWSSWPTVSSRSMRRRRSARAAPEWTRSTCACTSCPCSGA